MPQQERLNSGKLAWIEALRGIAALLVVLTHARYFLLNTPDWTLAEALLRPGAMGVDLFFIISGFIITHSTCRYAGDRATAGRFLLKRAIRVWPAYAVVTVAWVIFENGGMPFFLARHNLTVLAKSLLFWPVNPGAVLYFDMILPVGWTLVFEMYFYCVFALSMLFGRLRWFVLMCWFLLTVFLLPMRELTFSLDVLSARSGFLLVASNPIVLEFVAGVVIALAYHSRLRIASRAVAYLGIFASASLVLWYGYAGIGNFHGPSNWGWPLALMVLALAIGSKTVSVVFPRAVVWLGTISYSLYLTHPIAQRLLSREFDQLHLPTHSWGHVFIAAMFSIAIGYFAYVCLERGISDWLRRLLLGSPGRHRGSSSSSAPRHLTGASR